MRSDATEPDEEQTEVFADRMDAGVKPSHKRLHLKDKDPAVFALAHGGIPVGFQVAVALRAPPGAAFKSA